MTARALLLFLLSLLPRAAAADAPPLDPSGLPNGVQVGTLCQAETTVGVCAASDQLVLDARRFYAVSFWGLQSSGNYTCDVYGSDRGHDAGAGEAQKLNALPLTQASQMLTLAGPLGFVWVNCSTIAGSVTVTFIAIPLSR